MFNRVVVHRNLLHLNKISFWPAIFQNFKHDDSKCTLLPGGGLEKLQGGIKEEKYFNRQDIELIAKIREEGSKLKCESCIGNWAEFEKVLASSLRESSPNKQKDGMEEAFFLNEQTDCVQIMKDKLASEKVASVKADATTKILPPSPGVVKPPTKKL